MFPSMKDSPEKAAPPEARPLDRPHSPCLYKRLCFGGCRTTFLDGLMGLDGGELLPPIQAESPDAYLGDEGHSPLVDRATYGGVHPLNRLLWQAGPVGNLA